MTTLAKNQPIRVQVRRVDPRTHLRDRRGILIPLAFSTPKELLRVGIVSYVDRAAKEKQ